MTAKEKILTLLENINYYYNDCTMYDTIKNLLDEMAEEREKGKWVRDEFGSKCSSCGLYAYRDKFGSPWESNYCPNCGAEMEKADGN